jgi:hypothetical protein
MMMWQNKAMKKRTSEGTTLRERKHAEQGLPAHLILVLVPTTSFTYCTGFLHL